MVNKLIVNKYTHKEIKCLEGNWIDVILNIQLYNHTLHAYYLNTIMQAKTLLLKLEKCYNT